MMDLTPRVLTLKECGRLSPTELQALRKLGFLPPMAGGAVTANWYGLGLKSLAAAGVNWATDTIKVALVTSAYTPNQDTDQFFSTPAASELASGGGYTTGGVTLAGAAVSYDAASNEVRLTATSPVTWTFVGTKAFQYGIIYKSTGSNATSPLLGYVNYGAQSVSDTTFNSNIDATHGMLSITAA